MPLTEEIIEDARERFVRERDRYEKLTRHVEAMCVERIAESLSLRANITGRTKSPASFSRKLRRFIEKREKTNWNTTDDVFSELSDFSGVRIAYYASNDAEGVKRALEELFLIPGGFDEKDKRGPRFPLHSNYRATHCQVMLRDEALVGANENLRGLACEIQICSMMEHVWNEIEHDIGYKPVGSLGTQEKAALADLAETVRTADVIIKHLLVAHQERVNQEDAIASPVELAAFVADTFAVGRVTFWDSVGRVYESLQRLGLCTKRALNQAIGIEPEWTPLQRREAWNTARKKTHALNRWLRNSGHLEYLLGERNSADLILIMLLERNCEWVLRTIPAGRGKGRPPWIRGLASRVKESNLVLKASP